MKNNYSIDPQTNYYDTLNAYNLQGESPNSKHREHKYLGKIGGALKRPDKALWRHKEKVATAIADLPIIKYVADARDIASNPLVEQGLKNGEIITYPFTVKLLPWVHTEMSQLPMDRHYDPSITANVLNALNNPIVAGLVILSPFITYLGYRGLKWAYNRRKNKQVQR
jgi:hypothetical protein